VAEALQAALDELAGPNGPVPGLSAVVVRGSEVVWAGASGYADLARRVPAAPETVYLWFSMTKIATATAVVQLAQRGLLGLTSPSRPTCPSSRAGSRSRSANC
jgi:CubicO group peptidase (beta-lactamase class C family)